MEANQENIRSDDDIRRNSLYEALAKAQAEFPIIPKNKTGKITGKSKATGKEYSYEYKYADITDVLAAVRPILSKHGLAIIQKTQETEKEIIFTTKLVHNSGQSESATLFINKNQHPQDLGSIITYYRRYHVSMMTGVSAEEDTDANDLPKGNQTAASSKGNPGQQGQSVRVRPVQTTDFSKNSEGPGTQPTATGPKTPGVIALPKVPRLSPDEFITVGALAGQKITELPFHTLEDWIKKAEEHFGNSGIDPATSTTDVSRSYRSAKTHIASQATGAFEQDTGGGRLPQEP